VPGVFTVELRISGFLDIEVAPEKWSS
jgi:hypothetical protein